MTELIYEYGWIILISSEVIFWCTFIIFLLLRYWFNARGQNFFLFLSILNQFLNLPLAALDYFYHGQVSLFQIVVLLIYIYALTRGRMDMYNLDQYILRRIATIKSHGEKDRTIHAFEYVLAGKKHAKMERQKFYVHLSLYVLVHVLFLFSNSHLQALSQYWSVFLLIDALWSFSFTFFLMIKK